MKVDFRFEVAFEDDPGGSEIPEDCTIADFAIVVGDDYLTRHLQHGRLREGGRRVSNTVHGPLAGLVDWFIDNWSSILWETQTPFKRSSQYGSDRTKPPIPGAREAENQWEKYTQDSNYVSDSGEPDYARIAGWQHRHLLGHASSDLAIPSIVIVPEDRTVVIGVDRLPKGFFGFHGPDNKPRNPTQYIIDKADFRLNVTGFIETVVKRIHASGKHRQWADWVSERWKKAQDHESNPTNQLHLMIGEIGANRIEFLQRDYPSVAAGLKQLLLDCQIVEDKGELTPVEEVVKQYIGENGVDSGSRGGPVWESIKRIIIRSDQPEYIQGYKIARQVRKQMGLGARAIPSIKDTLEELDVKLEKDRMIPLFRAAACAVKGKKAHIIPSLSDPRMKSKSPHNFAVASALGRLLWEARNPDERTICVAQGDYSILSESRRANAFAAEFLLPAQVVARRDPNSPEFLKIADEFGISREAAVLHANDIQRDLSDTNK